MEILCLLSALDALPHASSSQKWCIHRISDILFSLRLLLLSVPLHVLPHPYLLWRQMLVQLRFLGVLSRVVSLFLRQFALLLVQFTHNSRSLDRVLSLYFRFLDSQPVLLMRPCYCCAQRLQSRCSALQCLLVTPPSLPFSSPQLLLQTHPARRSEQTRQQQPPPDLLQQSCSQWRLAGSRASNNQT